MIELKKIIAHFDLEIVGRTDRKIRSITALTNQQSDGLTWAKADEYANKIKIGTLLVKDTINFEPKKGVTYLITKKDAKLILSLIMKEFFAPSPDYYLFNDTPQHRKNAKIIFSYKHFLTLL